MSWTSPPARFSISDNPMRRFFLPTLRMLCVLTSLLVIQPAAVRSAEIKPLVQSIDAEIDRKLKDAKLTPAALSDDAEFLRRAYLDITGRIPTAKQAAAFLDSTEADKRAKLINELLASANYGEQMGRVWREWIAPAELPSEGNGGNQPLVATQNLSKWFAQRFNAGDGWDKIVRDVLTVNGTLKDAPQGIYYSLVGDDQGKPLPAGAARNISSLFMGVQLQCAECHNDPFKEWKQADFWGTAAFFRNMSWKFNGRYFDSIGEAFDVPGPDGKKATAINDKSPNGSITIPKEAFKNSGTIIPAKFVGNTAPYSAKEKQPLRPVFAEWLTAKENPYFAKAFVNRTWAYFFARGIVNPVDDMRDENVPLLPETLQKLTDDFVASNYDVRRLMRCITNTQAYQRSSRPSQKKSGESVALFGRMPVKLMSAEILYDSLKLAMTDPGLDLRNYDAKDAGRFGESSPVGSPYDEFVKLFTTNEDDATDFTHGIPQFLALINHPRLRTGGKTVEGLMKAKSTPEQTVEALYLSTLSRRPTSEEATEAQTFVGKSKDPVKSYNGVLWMLVNRSEFILVR